MPKLTADEKAKAAAERSKSLTAATAAAAADKPVGEQIAEQRLADTKTETGTRAPTEADFTAQVEAAAARAEAETPVEGGGVEDPEPVAVEGVEFVELTGQGDITRQFLEDSLTQIRDSHPNGRIQVQLRCAIRILDAEVVLIKEGGACFRSTTNGQTYWVTYGSIDAIIQTQ